MSHRKASLIWSLKRGWRRRMTGAGIGGESMRKPDEGEMRG
jgi:hypothetical protein